MSDNQRIEPTGQEQRQEEQGAPGPQVEPPYEPAAAEDIVSVNKTKGSDNRVAKALFLLAVGALLVGVLAWFSQDWLNARKARMREGSGPHVAEDTSQVFNPEKTGAPSVKPRLGAESGLPPPSQVATAETRPGPPRDDAIRPLRGADGKVMVNPQGRAMGVDKDGNLVEVPAITAIGGEVASGRRPLPGEGSGAPAGQGGAVQGQAQAPKPPSRYGGSLFVGDAPRPNAATAAPTGVAAYGAGQDAAGMPPNPMQQVADLMRMTGAGQGGSRAAAAPAVPEPPRPGTIGSALYASATPVARARLMADQNLILPKGRQADCILTGRIIDEVPGFTSCVLAQNLYSDNGRVLLLERGSELSGEYGVTNQLGLERLFVTWNRLKTPEGIEIDLSSPGADRLGTSGVPGHLDNRWASRIGAAFLLSFVKDITIAVIANQTQRQNSGGTSVTVGGTPGLNTMNASSALAEEVIKQTLKVRPRLTINEGDRVSIYVARDLDFSPVYALKTAGAVGATRLLAP